MAKNYFTSSLTKLPVIDKNYKKGYSKSDPFLDGFNAEHYSSLPKERNTRQQPMLQTSPYRSSVNSGVKFQTLPYIPSKDVGFKTTLYSKSPSIYTNVKKNAKSILENVWEEIKEPFEDRKNLLNEIKKIYGNLSPEAKSAMKDVLDFKSDPNRREKSAGILKDEIKKIHYKRNDYNVDLPKTKEIAKSRGWKPELAALHQNTRDPDEAPHIKYVSPDGKREVIFDHTGTRIITEDRDVGTYNYADPDLWLAHAILDILPWLKYGNTSKDTTGVYEKIRGALDFENYKNYFANH